MQALRSALLPKNGQFCSADIAKALSQLTLSDLQSYVPEAPVRRWMADRSFPIAAHAFSLHDALHSCGAGRWRGKFGDTIGCSTLYESPDVVFCWFVVPPGGILPLHDHYTMQVWQRVLYGRLRVTSIDWVKGGVSNKMARCQPHDGEGVVVASHVVEVQPAACDPSSVVASFGPDCGGVLHEIWNESAEPALFVDIIAPPYHVPPHNIQCTYFYATPADAGATPPSGRWEGSGCVGRLVTGQRVRVTPRVAYDGPPMDAFVLLQPIW